ncbi:hypothetical protein Q0812_00990 [Brevundimonas sp. 2R-24]|uniref:JAB domain-containing protein n=1 Tax=Peiella sedimenti TaxID=3061083 RepID=A0ABT8SI02_9CAUL|nr:hypothetical protein [Caulobacteraceae bacterium XZ-24]
MSDWWFEDGGWRPHGLQDAWIDVNSPLAEAPPPADPYAATAKSPAWTDDGPQFSWNDEDDDVTEVDGITVTGNPITPWDGGGGGGGGGPGSPDSDVDQLDPNAPPLPERPEGWSECDDRRADELARSIRDEIRNMPDSDRREYGALIYRDANGQLQRTTLMPGTNSGWTALNPASQPGDFGLTSWSQVVGVVHSHPTEREISPGVWVTVQPTDSHHLPNSGDWQWPDFMVSQGASSAMMRIYIVHGGDEYEYDMYQNTAGARQTQATNTGGTCGNETP